MSVKIKQIKPCPFCGVKAVYWDGDYFITHKDDCMILEISSEWKTWIVSDRMAKKWNKRIKKGKE